MKLRTLVAILLLINVVLVSGSITLTESGDKGVPEPIIENQASDDYPPFVPPPTNMSTLENGTIRISSTNIHWRFFSPNSSILYQDPNFQIAFDIWWENFEDSHVVSVQLAELGYASSYHAHYGIASIHTSVVFDAEDNFLHYGIWTNQTYFFMNMSKYLWCQNGFVNNENLNLTISIWEGIYYRLFSHVILRDKRAPTLQIIHSNYNDTSNELILDWNSMAFQINVTDRNDLRYGKILTPYTNQRTGLHEEMVLWESFDLENGVPIDIVLEQDVVEQYIFNASRTLQNPLQVDIEVLLVDEYTNCDTYTFTIYIDRPDTNSTSTTTANPWETMIPILGIGSITSVAVILLVIRKYRMKHNN